MFIHNILNSCKYYLGIIDDIEYNKRRIINTKYIKYSLISQGNYLYIPSKLKSNAVVNLFEAASMLDDGGYECYVIDGGYKYANNCVIIDYVNTDSRVTLTSSDSDNTLVYLSFE